MSSRVIAELLEGRVLLAAVRATLSSPSSRRACTRRPRCNSRRMAGCSSRSSSASCAAIAAAGSLLATPALSVTVNSTGERGLLGVTFDPNFASNNYLYVYYTATTPNIHNRLSRSR